MTRMEWRPSIVEDLTVLEDGQLDGFVRQVGQVAHQTPRFGVQAAAAEVSRAQLEHLGAESVSPFDIGWRQITPRDQDAENPMKATWGYLQLLRDLAQGEAVAVA